MTRRYNLSHAVGQPMPEDWLDLPDSVVAAADYDALAARLAEADKANQLLRADLAAAAREEDLILTALRLDPERYRTECGYLNVPKIIAAIKHPDEYPRLTDSASAVQPERCCLDYPRCDCNSPPEPDNAPTLQPCGHPWKAQHDSKCILCSSPGVTP